MVSFNVKDTKLPQVEAKTKLGKYVTKNTYRIYGLKQEENPQVLIEYLGGKFPKEQFDWLGDFLKSKKIDVQIAPLAPPKEGGNHKYDVYIGLREDVRNKSQKLCTAIAKTVIYHLENKLKENKPKGK